MESLFINKLVIFKEKITREGKSRVKKIIFRELFLIVIVKNVSAFGAEFRRMMGIFGLTAAFVAAIKGSVVGLLCAAFGAEFAFVDCTAGAGPACCLGLFGSAFGAEFAGRNIAAGAFPTVSGSCFRSGLRILLIILSNIHNALSAVSADCLSHIHTHKAEH